jgi:ABC-2 type transport system permease protein
MDTSQLVAFRTIVSKEITRFLRIWSQTILPSVITTSLYFLIFGNFVGKQVPPINGVSYIAFLVPGLVMLAVITNSFSNVVSSFFGSKFQRNIEELMVAPVSNWTIIFGFCIGGALRGIIVGACVLLVSLFFNPNIQVYNLGILLVFITLTSTVFALGGLTNGIFAKKFDDVSIFPTFVLTPLTYLGGVFYSIKSLPPFWQGVSKLNPIIYMVDGFRYGFYGFSDINVWVSLAILLAFTSVLLGTNVYLLNKGIGLKS